MSLDKKFEGKSRKGGITEVSFAFVDAQTRAYPETFYSVRFKRETVSFDEGQKNSNAGTIYSQNIKLRKSQLNEGLIGWIQQNAWQFFILRIRYANGLTREVGTTEYPLELTTKNTSGKKADDKNEASFTWKGEAPTPAEAVDGLGNTQAIPLSTLVKGLESVVKTFEGITMEAGQEVTIEHNQNFTDPHAFFFKLVLPDGATYSNFQPDSVTANSFTILAPTDVKAPEGATIYMLLLS